MDAMSGSEVPWPQQPKDNSGMIYIASAVASVLAIAIGAGAGKIEIGLLIGLAIPIGGVLFSLALVGMGIGPALKGHSGKFSDFTSFSPEVEQSFVVFEQTSYEVSKRAATIGAASVGVVGILFSIIVLTMASKEPAGHGAASGGGGAAAEQKH
jgi:hypothetical protein